MEEIKGLTVFQLCFKTLGWMSNPMTDEDSAEHITTHQSVNTQEF